MFRVGKIRISRGKKTISATTSAIGNKEAGKVVVLASTTAGKTLNSETLMLAYQK